MDEANILSAPIVAHLFNEETTVEREIIEHLQTPLLGWSFVPFRQAIQPLIDIHRASIPPFSRRHYEPKPVQLSENSESTVH